MEANWNTEVQNAMTNYYDKKGVNTTFEFFDVNSIAAAVLQMQVKDGKLLCPFWSKRVLEGMIKSEKKALAGFKYVQPVTERLIDLVIQEAFKKSNQEDFKYADIEPLFFWNKTRRIGPKRPSFTAKKKLAL